MIRSSITAAFALSILVAACNKASDDQKTVEKAQATASDKVTGALVEANEKIASAQAEANERIAAAQADFAKMREDYRHQTADDLTAIDEKVADLSAKETKLTGQAKASTDARLRQIQVDREAFAADFRSLEAASAATWDATKARLDKEMAALKSLVNRS
jgi:hypothetical protein